MAAGRMHDVLCPACHVPAKTLYAYPEKRCGELAVVEVPDGGVMRVSCTREPGTKQCQAGVHYDEFAKLRFTLPDKLRKGSWGGAGRI